MNASHDVQNMLILKNKCLSLIKSLKEYDEEIEPINVTYNLTQERETFEAAKDKFNKKIKYSETIYEKKTDQLKQLTMECIALIDSNNIKQDVLNSDVSREQTVEAINELVKTIDLNKSHLKKISEEQQSLMECATVPKKIKEYQLLAKLFSIQWDHNTSDRVKGFVLEPSNREVHPFDLDPEKNSQLFICNYLWQKLGNSEDFMTS